MTELPASLVIRRAPSRRGRLLVVAAVVAGLVVSYGIYQLGRYRGGYDMLGVAAERAQLEATTAKLEKANTLLRKQLAALDAMRLGRAQERAELAHTIGGLQAQIATQAEELTFYRDVVSHGGARGDPALGLELSELRVTAMKPAGRFDVRLTLLQTAHPEAAVRGSWDLRIEGSAHGKPKTLDLAALTSANGSRSAEAGLPFEFRYFKNVEQAISLPPGFTPSRLTVEVHAGPHAARKPGMPLIRTFPWRVEAQ